MCRFIVFLCLVTIQVISKFVVSDPVWEIIYKPISLPFLDMPDACYGMDYCFEKGDEYPDDKIAIWLTNVQQTMGQVLRNRQSDNVKGDDDPNCPVDTNYKDKPIYYVRDKRGDVRAVVQSPTKFQQIYSVKTCARPGRITKDTPDVNNTSFVASSLEKFNIECVDTYVDFDFIVLNDEYIVPRTEIVTTSLPVCCRCLIYDN